MAKRAFLIASTLLLAVAIASYAGGAGEKGKPAGKISVAFLTNTLNNSYQSTMNDTLKKLATEKGFDFLSLDPDYDLGRQLNQMYDLANKKVSVAFLIPVDSGGVHAGLVALQKAGVPVINIDTPVVAGDLDLVQSVVASDCYMAGVLDGQEMVKRHPDGGKIAILDFPENQSCVDRVEGFLKGLGESKNKFEIVAQQDGAAALAKSLPIAQDIIQAHPDLLAFFAINDPSAMGAVAAIKATKKTGIEVYSIDASPDGKAAMVDGTFTAVAAQVPIAEAQAAFKQALELLLTGKLSNLVANIPATSVDYYTKQWGTNLDKATYLPSFLVTTAMAKATAGKWQ